MSYTVCLVWHICHYLDQPYSWVADVMAVGPMYDDPTTYGKKILKKKNKLLNSIFNYKHKNNENYTYLRVHIDGYTMYRSIYLQIIIILMHCVVLYMHVLSM